MNAAITTFVNTQLAKFPEYLTLFLGYVSTFTIFYTETTKWCAQQKWDHTTIINICKIIHTMYINTMEWCTKHQWNYMTIVNIGQFVLNAIYRFLTNELVLSIISTLSTSCIKLVYEFHIALLKSHPITGPICAIISTGLMMSGSYWIWCIIYRYLIFYTYYSFIFIMLIMYAQLRYYKDLTNKELSSRVNRVFRQAVKLARAKDKAGDESITPYANEHNHSHSVYDRCYAFVSRLNFNQLIEFIDSIPSMVYKFVTCKIFKCMMSDVINFANPIIHNTFQMLFEYNQTVGWSAVIAFTIVSGIKGYSIITCVVGCITSYAYCLIPLSMLIIGLQWLINIRKIQRFRQFSCEYYARFTQNIWKKMVNKRRLSRQETHSKN